MAIKHTVLRDWVAIFRHILLKGNDATDSLDK